MTRPGEPLLHLGLFFCLAGDGFAGYLIITLAGVLKLLGFGLHFVLVIVFALLTKRLKAYHSSVDANFVLVSSLLTALLPVYGMLGIYFIYQGLRTVVITPMEYFEVDEEFITDRDRSFLENVNENILEIKRDELDIVAFRDVFRTHDRQLEENVINKLSKLVNKTSVSILQEVVKTTTSDTKVLAASALIDVEDKTARKIEELRRQLDRQPDDGAAMLELARSYDLHCHLGVLDKVVEAHYEKLAAEQYRNFIGLNPGHPEATFEFGRILLNSGKREEAIKIFREAIELAPLDPNPRIWLAEAYFESQNYAGVHRICENLSGSESLPQNLKETVTWWAGKEKALQN